MTQTTGDADSLAGQLFVSTGADFDVFGAELAPYANPPQAPCAGASTIVGPCCSFSAPPKPPLLHGDGGAGTPVIETSAGPLTLVDTTSNATISTFDYGAYDYTSIPATFPAGSWQPGDTLALSAAGDQIGAFDVSVPALVPPVPTFPASFSASQNLTVGWQPDPNADTMSISFDDSHGALVLCTAPDAQAEVTIDASLFAVYTPGEVLRGNAQREAQRVAQTAQGRIVLQTFGRSHESAVAMQ